MGSFLGGLSAGTILALIDSERQRLCFGAPGAEGDIREHFWRLRAGRPVPERQRQFGRWQLRLRKVDDKLPARNSRHTVLNLIVAALFGDKNMTDNFQAI